MNITFLQARNYTPGRKLPISLIVLHVMEWPEKPTAAAGCAYMFAGEKSPKASAHYCVDSNQIYQCVKDEDTAWHAKGGDANARGIGIELAGTPSRAPRSGATCTRRRCSIAPRLSWHPCARSTTSLPPSSRPTT
jgi:N-acetylmuramoyl-L-alanine amidase.